VCCTAPARLAGFSRKGHIAPGFDADLVIFDLAREVTLNADALHERVDRMPCEGMRLRGWPRLTLCRGRVIVEEGCLVEARQGRFVHREIDI